MVLLLAVDTVAVLMLALLVAALMRSHAEILRRIDTPSARRSTGREEPAVDPRLAPVAEARAGEPAHPISGRTLDDTPVTLDLSEPGPDTLLAFLSSGCSTCHDFWRAFSEGARTPAEARVVAVVKDPELESPSKLRKLARSRVEVLMSSRAWDDYDVPVAPYFVFVDGGAGKIHSEGAATRWEQVESLLEDAIGETPLMRTFDPQLHDSHPERIRAADETLAAAGIGPGHPSLYGGEPVPDGDTPENG
jgi:hypothetical protein